MTDVHAQAEALIEADRSGEALDLLNKHLLEHPDDARALYYVGNVLLEGGKATIAQCVYERANTLAPGRWMVLTNLARCYADQTRYDQAIEILTAVDRAEPGNVTVMNLLAGALIQIGEPESANVWSRRVLSIDPEDIKAHVNLGFGYLLMGDYAQGWDHYAWGQGHLEWRDYKRFAGEPEWAGHRGDVIVYCEQGIGDQIMMVDAARDLANLDGVRVHLECHKKLENLFRRSFPQMSVHGTQLRDINSIDWPNTLSVSASMSASQLQKHFRRRPDAWAGDAYLTPCPVRREQWAETFDLAPAVGLAWKGGLANTQRGWRSTELETFLPLMRSRPECRWVSLEYLDDAEEVEAFERTHGLHVERYPWATQSRDYDDTAALVAALDEVVATATSVVHLAGALGVSCRCIVPPSPHPLIGLRGDRLPYYQSVRLYRRTGDKWDDQIEAITKDMRE